MKSRARRGLDLGIELELLVHRAVQIRTHANSFRATQKQSSGGRERVMEGGEHTLLHRSAQIDQEIAATDEIELGERRGLW